MSSRGRRHKEDKHNENVETFGNTNAHCGGDRLRGQSKGSFAAQSQRSRLLEPGTARDLANLELGAPAGSRTENGKKIDLFSFVQGYSAKARAARATGHAAGEIVTLGLWGLVGTPIERSFNGTVLGYRVFYDENDNVASSERLSKKAR